MVIIFKHLSLSRKNRKGGIGRRPIDGHAADIKYKLKGSQLQLINPKTIATGIYQCEVKVKDGIVCMTRYLHFRGKSKFSLYNH